MFNPVQVEKGKRYSYARTKEIMEMPHLLDLQRKSYQWFKEEGLAEIFRDVSPISDFSGKLELFFESFTFDEPKYSLEECKRRDGTYAAPLRVKVKLHNKEKGYVKEQTVFFGDFPLMTETGTFIINGAERVIVSQLVRSPGVYFDKTLDPAGKNVYSATIIPNRGAWIEFEADSNFVISVRIDRTRKMPVTYLLRALDFTTNEQILELFDVNYFIYSQLNRIKLDESLFDLDDPRSNLVLAVLKSGRLFDEESFKRFVVGLSQDNELSNLKFLLELLLKINGTNVLAKAYKALIEMLDTDTKSGDDDKERALIGIYNRLRPGEPPSADNAQNLLNSLFFDPRRYDLAAVGRYKISKKLGLKRRLLDKTLAEDLVDDQTGEIIIPAQKIITKDMLENVPEDNTKVKITSNSGSYGIFCPTITDKRTISAEDIVSTISYMFSLFEGSGAADDIDHLGNRRVRAVGELLQNQFRIGMARMERVVKERMTTTDDDIVSPPNLINIRPVVAAIKEFFGSSQLSQFMDQHNPLSELTHKRRLSALGPGGLSRERAGFEVRDVHVSHYGRMCPIETPEGPNIGLIGSLSNYARVNHYGFIETPYRIVDKKERVITDKIVYLTADDEIPFAIAQANEELIEGEKGEFFKNEYVTARLHEETTRVKREKVDLMDVSPKQVVSVASALIPFLENDDANRALMGANMQRQAVPLLRTQAPLVGTGLEEKAARDSGVMILAKQDGTVTYVDADKIIIDDRDVYNLKSFLRSNQGTCINQTPLVYKGQVVKKGQTLADGPATKDGELALGQNIIVAYMPWEGYNYEDAILLNENILKKDLFSSIHIEEYQADARDTKLGPEEISRDIPNVAEEALANLDSEGIIRIGADCSTGDILVGKVTPKGETELTAEERLLRAIFGEKAREVRDTSLRLPHGQSGTVLAVNIFTRDINPEMPPGVNMQVRVYIAKKRKISVGDKMSGRHGNKGVVSSIRRQEDMPFLPDGTPVDIVLNPLGVPSRMNIGQILETHLGNLNSFVATPVFSSPNHNFNFDNNKKLLRDGRDGMTFLNRVTVGTVYMLKLHHLVDDKIHARSTGPYSLVTQQPLGGKAQFGGQRFGEMEVWALEAYGAAYTLQEILTVKSDDVNGRVKAYEAIVKGQNIPTPGVPESFKVLIKELQAIALDIRLMSLMDCDFTEALFETAEEA